MYVHTVLTEILGSEVPYDSPEYRKMGFGGFIECIKQGARPHISSNIKKNHGWVCDIIKKGWDIDPSERCTAAEMHAELERGLVTLYNSLKS